MLTTKAHIPFRYEGKTRLLKIAPDNTTYFLAKEGLRAGDVEITVPPHVIDVHNRYDHSRTYVGFSDLTRKLVATICDNMENSPGCAESDIIDLQEYLRSHKAADFDNPIKLIQKKLEFYGLNIELLHAYRDRMKLTQQQNSDAWYKKLDRDISDIVMTLHEIIQPEKVYYR